jgi:SAM-dependent methyltransferase
VETVGRGSLGTAAEAVRAIGEELVERAGVEPGMEVLDVGTGTGNAAVPACGVGARVTGLEPGSDLLDVARERAADYMLEPEWVVGDVAHMPFEDASFDRVLSVFGHMFEPDQERAAGELRRVCRPDGALALCAWTPEGLAGRMLGLLEHSSRATDWGDEARVRELLGDRVEAERRTLALKGESPEACAAFAAESLAPFGVAPSQRDRLVELFPDCDFEMEYLMVVVRP